MTDKGNERDETGCRVDDLRDDLKSLHDKLDRHAEAAAGRAARLNSFITTASKQLDKVDALSTTVTAHDSKLKMLTRIVIAIVIALGGAGVGVVTGERQAPAQAQPVPTVPTVAKAPAQEHHQGVLEALTED